MDITALIITLAMGALAGWIAGQIMKGRGLGLVGNIIVGIVGAFIGGWLFGVLGVSLGAGAIGALIQAVIGAVVLLLVVGLIKR